MVKSRLIAVDKKQCIADKPVRKYQLGCGVQAILVGAKILNSKSREFKTANIYG